MSAQFAGRWNKWIEIVYGEKKIFCTGPTRAAETKQKSLVQYQHHEPKESTKEGPLSFVLWIPIHLSFNSQQGPVLSSLSGLNMELLTGHILVTEKQAEMNPTAANKMSNNLLIYRKLRYKEGYSFF